jgi:hypothetical protein
LGRLGFCVLQHPCVSRLISQRACAVKDKLETFTNNCTKKLLQWNENTFLHWRHAFTPKDFQVHQQSLDHSYCKRETSLTKLKNSKSVMILVVRLAQLTNRGSPTWKPPPNGDRDRQMGGWKVWDNFPIIYRNIACIYNLQNKSYCYFDTYLVQTFNFLVSSWSTLSSYYEYFLVINIPAPSRDSDPLQYSFLSPI